MQFPDIFLFFLASVYMLIDRSWSVSAFPSVTMTRIPVALLVIATKWQAL